MLVHLCYESRNLQPEFSRLEEFTKLGRDPVGKAGNIPDHLLSCSAMSVGIRRKCRILGVKVLVFLSKAAFKHDKALVL